MAQPQPRGVSLSLLPCGCAPLPPFCPMQNKSWSESRKKTPHGHVAQRAAGAAPGEEADVPGEESLEALMEFVSSQGSPWALPPGCSPEDQHLKELAVQSPQLIQDSFIFLFFTSLRLVDKGVSAATGIFPYLGIEREAEHKVGSRGPPRSRPCWS